MSILWCLFIQYLSHPFNLKHEKPHNAVDIMKTEKRLKCWQALLARTEVTQHIFNMILERLDNADYVRKTKVLREVILGNTEEFGEVLSLNACHLSSLALHFNSRPGENKWHTDPRSSYSGVDIVAPYGDFHSGFLGFKELGIKVPLEPGDIIVLRGATFSHKAIGWEGTGRMVFVPFVDRALYPYHHREMPRFFKPLYGKRQWNNLRKLHPAKRLPTFVVE